MSLKLKLGSGAGGGGRPPSTSSNDNSGPQSAGGSGLKLKFSQPPTPATDQPAPFSAEGSRKKKPSAKKRAANEDISPAAKRVASDAGETRRPSVMLKMPKGPGQAPSLATPGGSKLKLSAKAKRQSTGGPILRRLNVKGRVPERAPGNGYDSEDSERELDPATEQQLILRMEPGEDCDYLRNAIAEKKIGLPQAEGGADVTLRFVERELKRAVVTIRGRMYAAALVDLPCIVETMKSWDKKGWWKVADIHQMLLVLGRCRTEDEAKTMPLPARVVNSNMQYAHGLTPPMHWVRKRRFRKRLTYKDTANVEEEVQKLLQEDEEVESRGGEVNHEIVSRESLERSVEPEQYYEDDEGEEPIDTIEDGYEMFEEMDVDATEAALQAEFDMDAPAPEQVTDQPVSDSPVPLADAASSYAQVNSALQTPGDTPAAETPAETPAGEEPSSDEDDDEDEDEDEDGVDVVDEDAAAKAAERNQLMEEYRDLEREVERQREKFNAQKNQLLKERTLKQLRSLEEDLRMKKQAVGLGDEEDE